MYIASLFDHFYEIDSDCSQLLVIMSNAAVNMGVWILLREHILTSDTAVWYDNSMFNFGRNCLTVDHSSCAVLHAQMRFDFLTSFKQARDWSLTLRACCLLCAEWMRGSKDGAGMLDSQLRDEEDVNPGWPCVDEDKWWVAEIFEMCGQVLNEVMS